MKDKKDQLIRIIREAESEEADQNGTMTMHINGNHNIIGHSNTIIHANKITHRVKTLPPPGSISPAQAQTIRELLAEWKTVYDRVKKKPISWGAAWERFKKKFRVNSYLQLPSERFEEACQWLRRQRAIIDHMKTASHKDPDWRKRQIKYIKARCKQLGNEYAYQPYITRFGKTSLADLTDDELARTRAYIAHKKTA